MKHFKIFEKKKKWKGTVKMLWRRASDGQVVADFTIHNLIVDVGRGQMCQLLLGNATGNFVASIGWGTSATATTVADTTLTGGSSVAIGTATLPSGTSVQFPFHIATTDANGLTLQELGLITGDGTLFSRVVIPAVVKTSAIYLDGTWTIEF